MRAWDRRTTALTNTQASTSVMGSENDPSFAHGSTLRTIERTIVDDFGEDPVVFARSHGSSTQDERLNGDDEAKQWMPMEEIPSGSDRDEQHSGEEHASRDA